MAGSIKSRIEGAPSWIITFADLSTLMLTFFVLLLSFSNQDIAKFREMLGSVQGAFGVTIKREGEVQAALTGEGVENVDTIQEQEKEKLKRQIFHVGRSVKKAANEANMGNDVDVLSIADGTRVRVRGEALFAAGSLRINPKSVPLLDGLAKVIRKTHFTLSVEGHTDNRPVSARGGALYTSNWELSGVRAAVVVRYLITKQVDPVLLAAVGYGDMRPVASNDTAEGRAKNRRVEFLIRKP